MDTEQATTIILALETIQNNFEVVKGFLAIGVAAIFAFTLFSFAFMRR